MPSKLNSRTFNLEINIKEDNHEKRNATLPILRHLITRQIRYPQT